MIVTKSYTIFFLFISYVLFQSCKEGKKSPEKEWHDTDYFQEKIDQNDSFQENNNLSLLDSIDVFTGDTIRIACPASSWYDSIAFDDYKATLAVRIDTTDLIIDTVRSASGSKILIGYNHYYTIKLNKHLHTLFIYTFNKKDNLEYLLGGSDFWIDSNLDIFRRFLHNEKYNNFVVEFSIHPHYDYDALYYFILSSEGENKYMGTAGGWGGSDPDGQPFITGDREAYVSCNEIYFFRNNSVINLTDYASLATQKTYDEILNYKWLHGMRELSNNNFLVVFEREGTDPVYNALIINTDTTVVNRFKYYGIMEEMDAILLFRQVNEVKKYFILDSEREQLICIDEENPASVEEYDINELPLFNADTLSKDYYTLDFELLGIDPFYVSIKGKMAVYYSAIEPE